MFKEWLIASRGSGWKVAGGVWRLLAGRKSESAGDPLGPGGQCVVRCKNAQPVACLDARA